MTIAHVYFSATGSAAEESLACCCQGNSYSLPVATRERVTVALSWCALSSSQHGKVLEQTAKLESLQTLADWGGQLALVVVATGNRMRRKRLKLQWGRVTLSLRDSESLEQLAELLLEGWSSRSGTQHPARLSGSFAVLEKWIEWPLEVSCQPCFMWFKAVSLKNNFFFYFLFGSCMRVILQTLPLRLLTRLVWFWLAVGL